MALAADHQNGIELPSSLLELLAPASTVHNAPDLTTFAAKAYVDRLITLGLDSLVQEPGLIDYERSAVDLELVNLCYREYPTFTSVHKCSSAVGAAFDDFAKSLDQLIDSIPALEDECRQFGRGTSSIQTSRRKAVLLQDHEDKLMGVLEIPQLMETCVRNGYYQEALELSSHVSELRQKYETTVMDDIAEETNSVLQLMTAQLLGVLREPVKLPVLLKAVGYLRRLQNLDEVQLGLVFLSSRLHNYRARLVEIEMDRGEPVRYLRRYIDLFREHVFDIISQYTTIFANIAGDQLASFVSLCVEDLAQLVQRYIPRIASDSASMSSILVQLGYCSLSFARAGLDFSSLLVDPFKSSVLHSYDQAVSSAASLLVDTLALDAQAATTPANLVISAQYFQQVLVDPYSPPRRLTVQIDAQTPPPILAHFPPLAHFLNAHLTSLNALRLLAPFQSLSALLASQTRSIQQATSAVMDYCEQAVSTQAIGDLSRTGSRHRHSRSNSTPRAHLLRQNTETLLSAETLAAKRRETKRVCVAFADAWLTSRSFLHQAMCLVLEMDPDEGRPNEAADHLRRWIKENSEKDAEEAPKAKPASKDDRSASMVSFDESAEVDRMADEHMTPNSSRPRSVDQPTFGEAGPSVSAEPLQMDHTPTLAALVQPAVTQTDNTINDLPETALPLTQAEPDGQALELDTPKVPLVIEDISSPAATTLLPTVPAGDAFDVPPEPNGPLTESEVPEAPAPTDESRPAEQSDANLGPSSGGTEEEGLGEITMRSSIDPEQVVDVNSSRLEHSVDINETIEPIAPAAATKPSSPVPEAQVSLVAVSPSTAALEVRQLELEPAADEPSEAVQATPTIVPIEEPVPADPVPTPDASEPATPGEEGDDNEEIGVDQAQAASGGGAKAIKKKKKKKGKK